MINTDFGWALGFLKQGKKLARKGWNASNQWATYQKAYPEGIPINKNTADATGIPEGTVCKFRPYFLFKTADDSFVPWVPSVSDILADDWVLVD